MSRGNRRSVGIAARSGIIATALLLPSLALGNPGALSIDNAAHRDEGGRSTQPGSEGTPLVVQVTGAPSREELAKDHRDDARRHDVDQRWVIGIGVTAILAALAQAVVLIWQIVYLRGTLGHAQISSERELRAYVFPRGADLLDGRFAVPVQKALVNQPGAFVAIQNYGQTPAYKLVSWADIAVIDVMAEDKLSVPIPVAFQSASSVPPGGAISKLRRLPRKITAQEAAGIAAGSHGIFIYGRAEYVDAFGKNRFTNFRLSYTGQWPPIKGATFTFCNGGNETDENI